MYIVTSVKLACTCFLVGLQFTKTQAEFNSSTVFKIINDFVKSALHAITNVSKAYLAAPLDFVVCSAMRYCAALALTIALSLAVARVT